MLNSRLSAFYHRLRAQILNRGDPIKFVLKANAMGSSRFKHHIIIYNRKSKLEVRVVGSQFWRGINGHWFYQNISLFGGPVNCSAAMHDKKTHVLIISKVPLAFVRFSLQAKKYDTSLEVEGRPTCEATGTGRFQAFRALDVGFFSHAL